MTQKRFNNLKVGDKIKLRVAPPHTYIYVITKVIRKGYYELTDRAVATSAGNWSLVPSPRKPRKKKGK